MTVLDHQATGRIKLKPLNSQLVNSWIRFFSADNVSSKNSPELRVALEPEKSSDYTDDRSLIGSRTYRQPNASGVRFANDTFASAGDQYLSELHQLHEVSVL